MRCSEFIRNGGVLLDIGTDHAMLPCYAVESGRVSGAVAADIAEGPLAAARRNVESRGLSERISLYLSDGFLKIPAAELERVTDVVIAGMGGEMIAKILEDAGDIPKKMNLILQPNTRAETLRKYLAEKGYEILDERAVRDGGFVYAVMNARYAGGHRNLDDLESLVGRIDPADGEGREYIILAAKRLRAAAEGKSRSKSPEAAESAERLFGLAGRLEDLAENITERS